MKGRFNIFQRAMLRWRELHPYNAVHVVPIDAPLDAVKLARDIDTVFAHRGLTGLVLDAEHHCYEYMGGTPRTVLEVLQAGADPAEVVRAAIERGINTRFAPSGPSDPFKFFAVDEGIRFNLGLAYDHVMASGDSIVGLLADISRLYTDGVAPAAVPSLYPGTSGAMLIRHAGYVLAGLAAVPRALANSRRSVRARYPHGEDRRNAFLSARIERPGAEALSRASRAWGVTRADLMIALLMKAIAPLIGAARHSERRREIGIAWIVNIRREFGTTVRESFGQFLSSFRLAHPVPDGITLRELAQDVHRETATVRRRKLYLITLLPLAVLGFLWPRLSPRQKGSVDAKNYPAWAGLTPLDVDAVWREACGAEPPREYLRAVSTGPASPLIVATSSVGGELRIGFSYRVAAYTADDIAKIAASLVNEINKIAA